VRAGSELRGPKNPLEGCLDGWGRKAPLLKACHFPRIEGLADAYEECRSVARIQIQKRHTVDVFSVLNALQTDHPDRGEQQRIWQGARNLIRMPLASPCIKNTTSVFPSA